MAFDPSQLKKHKRKGQFRVKTQKDEIDDSDETTARDQQDLLATQLNRTRRKDSGELRLPRLFTIRGKQISLYQEALAHVGHSVTLDPKGEYDIDRSGFCPAISLGTEGDERGDNHLGNSFLLISPEQSKADIVHPQYSFLDRMLGRFEKEFRQSIVSFTRGEAVVGNIDNVVIDQGVERFLREGLYTRSDAVDVTATISTPQDSIAGIRELQEASEAILQKPENLTRQDWMGHLLERSNSLKVTHRKLADLIAPDADDLYYPVSSFRYSDEQLELFYFRTGDTPVFVFFSSEGKEISDHFDREFIILNGNDRSGLVNNLLDIGMIDYLVEFTEEVRDGYVPTGGGSGLLSGLRALSGDGDSNLPERWHTLNEITTTLRMSSADGVLSQIASGYEVHGDTDSLENARGQYVRSLPADLKSEIIFPRSELEDTLICDIISRSSPNRALQVYRDTSAFMDEFSGLDTDGQVAMLREIDQSLKFENQNNPLANIWLSEEYAQVCKDAGLSFYRN